MRKSATGGLAWVATGLAARLGQDAGARQGGLIAAVLNFKRLIDRPQPVIAALLASISLFRPACGGLRHMRLLFPRCRNIAAQ